MLRLYIVLCLYTTRCVYSRSGLYSCIHYLTCCSPDEGLLLTSVGLDHLTLDHDLSLGLNKDLLTSSLTSGDDHPALDYPRLLDNLSWLGYYSFNNLSLRVHYVLNNLSLL